MHSGELPNYNLIGVFSSRPGVDHAADAEALFNPDADATDDDGARDGNEEEVDMNVFDRTTSVDPDATMEDIDGDDMLDNDTSEVSRFGHQWYVYAEQT